MRTVVFSLLLASAAIVSSANICVGSKFTTSSQDGFCRPFGNGSTCAVGDTMDLRFRLQVTGENANLPGIQTNNYITYGVCAKVDELQAFELTNASIWGAGNQNGPSGGTFISTMSNMTTIDVFGMGPLPYRDYPLASDDGGAIYYQNVSGCGENGFSGPAVVNFLVLNITMTNGAYSYSPSESPLPVQSGFVPTCKDGTCLMDSNSVCVGEGKQSCATCVNSNDALMNTKLHIWAAYYGTDKNGRRFTSGSNNPVNFQQFSSDPVFNKIKGSL